MYIASDYINECTAHDIQYSKVYTKSLGKADKKNNNNLNAKQIIVLSLILNRKYN